MAGPGFDGGKNADPKMAAIRSQCIHTASGGYGTRERTCHQNWLMGNCGEQQIGQRYGHTKFRWKRKAIRSDSFGPALVCVPTPTIYFRAKLKFRNYFTIEKCFIFRPFPLGNHGLCPG